MATGKVGGRKTQQNQEREERRLVAEALEAIEARPKRKKPKGAGGPRRARMVVEMHVRRCVDLLKKGKYRSEIINAFAQARTPIPASTVDRYVSEAQLRLQTDEEDARKTDRIVTRHHLAQTAKFLKGKEAYGAMMRAESLLLDVKGLRGPSTVVINPGPAQAPRELVAVPVDQLSDAFLEEIDRLAEQMPQLAAPESAEAIEDAVTSDEGE